MTNLDPHTEALFDHGAMRMKACRYGAMLYNIHDQFIGRSFDLYGEYAEDEMGLLSNFLGPGQFVMDVGANIGAHTLFFAQKIGPEGRVLAFEPQRQVFQNLCANVALNGLSNVMTFHAGAADQHGMTAIPTPDYNHEGNFGAVSLLPDPRVQNAGTEPVQLMTLDQLGLPHLALLKIDVEGMELAVLKGAAQTIQQHRPALYIENDRPEASPALLGYLKESGYRVYWHVSPLFNPHNVFANSENVFGRIVSKNVLCLPGEAQQNITGLVEVEDIHAFPA